MNKIYSGTRKPEHIYFSQIHDPTRWESDMKTYNFRFVWLRKLVCWFGEKFLGWNVYCFEDHLASLKQWDVDKNGD